MIFILRPCESLKGFKKGVWEWTGEKAAERNPVRRPPFTQASNAGGLNTGGAKE